MAGPDQLLALLDDVDRWLGRRQSACDLVLMGGAALVLAHGSRRATKDLDIVVRGQAEVEEKGLAGLETDFGRASGREPWIDLVLSGLPCLPEGWTTRTVPLPGPWTQLTVRRLSDADQVSAKLKAWRPHDRRDIEFLLTRHPEARTHLERLAAVDFWYAEDIWEEKIEPRLKQVLRWMDGELQSLG